MFFVNISDKENTISLKFKKCPSLDAIKQIIRKKMKLEIDDYNLMIADEVIMSDEHLVSVFHKEENQCHLNIIKHAELAHQAHLFSEEHASDVLVYHPDEDVQQEESIPEKLIEAHHEHNDEVAQASVLQQQAVEEPEVVQASDNTDVLEQSNQPGLVRNQAGMMNFLMHLWQWITNFFMQLLGRIEAEPTHSSSMSFR